jgi:hypothetical protein
MRAAYVELGLHRSLVFSPKFLPRALGNLMMNGLADRDRFPATWALDVTETGFLAGHDSSLDQLLLE